MNNRFHALLLAAGIVTFAGACSDQGSDPLALEEPEAQGSDLAPLHEAAGTAVPNSYIVVLNDGVAAGSVTSTMGIEPRFSYGASTGGPGAELSLNSAPAGEATGADFAINGFAAMLDAGQLEALRRDPKVKYVEQDQYLTLAATQSTNGDMWGLDRIDQRSSSLSESYTYGASGSGVYVYMIDTGIQADHPEFEGRAKNVFNAVGGTNSDCHGHGTAVAGIVGAKTYGVAKDVYLRGLKTVDCEGSGRNSDMLAAMDWILKNRANPAVVNLSLISSHSPVINDAIERLVRAGIFVAAGAGNNDRDACNYSPASAPDAFTVTASDRDDHKASYSNYGKCVDSYAPGSSIKTTHLGDDAARWTGTSMASPHVAGVAAIYRGRYRDASPATVTQWLKSNATDDVIDDNPSGTPNRLLFSPALGAYDSDGDDGGDEEDGDEKDEVEEAPAASWTSRDIGSVAAKGSFDSRNDEFTIRGSGRDIWGSSDEFHFAYQQLDGDGEIVARVASQSNTDPWAKAGVMIRESLSSRSEHAMVVTSPDNGIAFQYRDSYRGRSGHMAGGRGSAPEWVRMVRRGDTITGYRSEDGKRWTKIGSVIIDLPTKVYVGLATTSHDDGTLSTANFENVRLED